jgi:MFS family permease
MKRSYYPWVVVGLLWVVAALNYVDRQVIFALFPLLRNQLHLTDVELGFLGTAFLWVYGVFSPIGGYLADRIPRRRVILFSLGVWSTVTIAVGLSQHYAQLVAAQAMLGISEAFYLPAALALITDYHGSTTRSRAIGLHQSGLYAGVALGGWGGGWIGQSYGWHHVFYVLGLFGLIYTAVLFFSLREAPRAQEDRRSIVDRPPVSLAVRELATCGSFWVLVVANCFSAMAFWSVYAWMALFLFDRFRLSLADAGFSSTFYIQVASFAGIFVGGWLADRWAQKEKRARLFVQVIGFLFGGPGLFIAVTTGSWPMLMGSLLLFGLGRGFYDCNLMPVLCQIIPEQLRATGYGILNSTSTIAGGIMATAAGMLKDRIGLGHALQVSAAMLVLSALCLAVVRVGRAGFERVAASA